MYMYIYQQVWIDYERNEKVKGYYHTYKNIQILLIVFNLKVKNVSTITEIFTV